LGVAGRGETPIKIGAAGFSNPGSKSGEGKEKPDLTLRAFPMVN
jgi:hypothetical protein